MKNIMKKENYAIVFLSSMIVLLSACEGDLSVEKKGFGLSWRESLRDDK